MSNTNNTLKGKINTNTIIGLGLLTAIVVVMQFISMGLRFGTFSITLTLIPIVVGSALYGWGSGAWLGFVFGVTVLLTGDANLFLAVNIPGTIITVILKGALAGAAAGFVYKLISKKKVTKSINQEKLTRDGITCKSNQQRLVRQDSANIWQPKSSRPCVG